MLIDKILKYEKTFIIFHWLINMRLKANSAK